MNIATVRSAPEVGLLKDKGHHMCMVFMCTPEKKNYIHICTKPCSGLLSKSLCSGRRITSVNKVAIEVWSVTVIYLLVDI